MINSECLVRASCLCLGLWSVLHGAQWLADLPRWADGGPLGWDLQGLRKGFKGQSSLLARLYRQRGLRGLTIFLVLTGLCLIALPLGSMTVLLLGSAVTAIVLLSQRTQADGADKMAIVVGCGALIQTAGLALGNQTLVLAGGLWTGGQLTIAYFAAGASKLILRDWRSGAAPRAALSSYMWGNRISAWGVKLPGAAVALAWAVMLLEISFPLALLMPLPFLATVLAGFLLFHLVIAVVMGLNSYPLAFLAAYPATIWLGQWLRHTLGLA